MYLQDLPEREGNTIARYRPDLAGGHYLECTLEHTPGGRHTGRRDRWLVTGHAQIHLGSSLPPMVCRTGDESFARFVAENWIARARTWMAAALAEMEAA